MVLIRHESKDKEKDCRQSKEGGLTVTTLFSRSPGLSCFLSSWSLVHVNTQAAYKVNIQVIYGVVGGERERLIGLEGRALN